MKIKNSIFILLILTLIAPLLLTNCATAIRKDRLNRIETYGYLTLRETTIYETSDGVKIIGTLPKYYNFMLNKHEVRVDNGLIRILYDTDVKTDQYYHGWIKLNDIKLFCVWSHKEVNISTQREISNEKYPVVASKAEQYISEFEKGQEPWNETFLDAIDKNEITLGMNHAMVMLSLGIPTKVNFDKGTDVIEEQWVYSRTDLKTFYVYFKDGKVTNTQIVGKNL